MGGYGRKGSRERGKGEVRADASERIVWSVAVEKFMCTPCFCPSFASRGYQLSYRGTLPMPPNGRLTVRRPRETIPVNFRVVMNFDIAIDAVTTFGGRVDGSKMGLGGGGVVG